MLFFCLFDSVFAAFMFNVYIGYVILTFLLSLFITIIVPYLLHQPFVKEFVNNVISMRRMKTLRYIDICIDIIQMIVLVGTAQWFLACIVLYIAVVPQVIVSTVHDLYVKGE